MKLLSLITLTALLSITACSHHNKSCCSQKEAQTCTKEKCDKPCCAKDKKCADGSCDKKEDKDCKDGSCHKDAKKTP